MTKLAFQRPRVEHGHDWKGGAAWVLCAILALGWIDALDNSDWHRRDAAQARADLAREIASRPLPPHLPRVMFVFEARSRQDVANRFADIAGAADLERYKMREGK